MTVRALPTTRLWLQAAQLQFPRLLVACVSSVERAPTCRPPRRSLHSKFRHQDTLRHNSPTTGLSSPRYLSTHPSAGPVATAAAAQVQAGRRASTAEHLTRHKPIRIWGISGKGPSTGSRADPQQDISLSTSPSGSAAVIAAAAQVQAGSRAPTLEHLNQHSPSGSAALAATSQVQAAGLPYRSISLSGKSPGPGTMDTHSVADTARGSSGDSMQRELWRQARKQINEYEQKAAELQFDQQQQLKSLQLMKDELQKMKQDVANAEKATLEMNQKSMAAQRRHMQMQQDVYRAVADTKTLTEQVMVVKQRLGQLEQQREALQEEFDQHLQEQRAVIQKYREHNEAVNAAQQAAA